MPIYEYRCQACGHAFEQLVRSMSKSQRIACPECGNKKAQRQMSVFAARESSDAPGCPIDSGTPSCAQCPGQGKGCPF